MNTNINVEYHSKKYIIDLDRAADLGLLKPAFPLTPGDVYKAASGACNPFLLVQTRYPKKEARYQLLGIGCNINSGSFFESADGHSLTEIEGYLELNNMIFSHNINEMVSELVYGEGKKKVVDIG